MKESPLIILLLIVVSLDACDMGRDSASSNDSAIAVALSPGDFEGTSRLRWSPKGATVPLHVVDAGLEGSIMLGSEGLAEFRVRLERGGNSKYFDVLKIDANRNGGFDDDESVSTTPNEVRYSMWSSFESSLDVMVRDSVSGNVVTNPYPLSLWYVESLREEPSEYALRFTRNGWMQGRVLIDGVDAHIRLSESYLDGIFTLDDGWTLALPDSAHNLFEVKHERPGRRHAWLGERGYQIASINPTGRSLVLEYIDPGVTRGQEAEDDDQTAVDRRAPHTGGQVVFRHDFAQAENDAKVSGKILFIDFDAVWCGPCKVMDEWVYTADSVVLASENVVSVKVDGDDYPEIAQRFEVAAYPTMIRLSPDGEIVGRLVGYQGVEAMTSFLSQ